MLCVRKMQDSAFIDPGMAMDRLDLDFQTTWRTEKLSLTDWIERMGAAKRGGIFSTRSEMEYELELVTKSKASQTPARGPFKNEEGTIDLDWTPYSPQLSRGTALSDLDITVVAAAVEAVEKVIIHNEERLKLFLNKLTD
jgi:hypothetical protein